MRCTGRLFRGLVTAAFMLLWVSDAIADDVAGTLDRGNRAYAARGVANDGRGRAEPGEILEAIDAYEDALREDPADIEARWRAMAALYFAGDFAAPNEEVAHEFYDRGRVLGEEGMVRIRERLQLDRELSKMKPEEIREAVPDGLVSDVAELYFWSAIEWGAWARTEGLLKVVTEGVAGRLRSYAKVSLALDPSIYRGGSQRLLAHMHANLPRVPFISGWVDRGKAVGFAEQAMAVRPDDVGNRTILGLVLLDAAPARREEALEILEAVVATSPRAELLVEDQATREMARERLEKERGREQGG